MTEDPKPKPTKVPCARAAGIGRKAGVPNIMTRTLKEAIHGAAASIGLDGKGLGGLTGYLIRVGLSHPTALASLLGKTLPTEVSATVTHDWDLGKLSNEELNVLARISNKAQRSALFSATAEPSGIIDLSREEYAEHVDDIVRQQMPQH